MKRGKKDEHQVNRVAINKPILDRTPNGVASRLSSVDKIEEVARMLMSMYIPESEMVFDLAMSRLDLVATMDNIASKLVKRGGAQIGTLLIINTLTTALTDPSTARRLESIKMLQALTQETEQERFERELEAMQNIAPRRFELVRPDGGVLSLTAEQKILIQEDEKNND